MLADPYVVSEASAPLVAHALRTGYRPIDTAEAYDNEEGVPRVSRRAFGVSISRWMSKT